MSRKLSRGEVKRPEAAPGPRSDFPVQKFQSWAAIMIPAGASNVGASVPLVRWWRKKLEDQNQRRRARAPALHDRRPFLDTLSYGLYSLSYFLENLLFRACFRGSSRYDSAARRVPDVHRNPRT